MDDTLDLNGAAELLKVNTETVRIMAASGMILGAKVGVGWVFIKADLLDYLRAEARRQTNERRAAAEAAKLTGGKPEKVTTGSGLLSGRRRRRELPDLSALDDQGA